MAEVRVVIRIVFRSGERHNEQEVAKIEWGESRPPQSVAFSRVPSLIKRLQMAEENPVTDVELVSQN